MHDPFITALNTQKTTTEWIQTISQNLSNMYTPGYRAHSVTFSDFVNGVQLYENPREMEQGQAMPGRGPTNMMIEGDGYFVVRNKEDQLLFTRLGDFDFNGEGLLVNKSEYKVQGYLLGEDGKVISTAGSNSSPAGNNPSHSQGGPGHVPTTEINLWVDPSNGKYFGKYDEYKIRSDGTVVGVANKGKDVVPLYKIAMANFVNPGGMMEAEDHMFVPTKQSGEPVEGTGEVRSGYLEKSNVSLKSNVNYLQQAKIMMDVSSKLISTNKQLLEEALRLLQ